MTEQTSVHLVGLGCARNDVDTEELAARLADGGFSLAPEPEGADVVVVNTCGFIEQAKKDSIDELLAAGETSPGAKVVAVGCMAERYGAELAAELPEADAVLGFDAYPHIADRVRQILAGERIDAHTPSDRRTLLPISPVARKATGGQPGHGAPPDLPDGMAPANGPRVLRRRLGTGPSAPLKIASGCDRRCAFCAIPQFRGSHLSRPIADIVAEARWLVDQGVREVYLVSENTSSYGKDLGEPLALAHLLAELSSVDGLEWTRVSYLQPAELRPEVVHAICGTDHVVPYFDIPFQHAAPALLRRMRRFGDPDSFLQLLETIRARDPRAGVRSNVIVGFPGETEEDVEMLTDFLGEARLDVVGVFGYSDEDNTEAATLDGKVDEAEVDARRERVVSLVEELMDQRGNERVGEQVTVLVENSDTSGTWGRAAHQGPETDGECRVEGPAEIGSFVTGTVVSNQGADLEVEA